MALILNIETATTVCSAALSRNGIAFVKREENKGYTHAENLTAFIEEMMQEAGLSFSELDAVAVSSGPGSYTGLRIGVSTAKGYCYALDKPLIAVPTLQSLANGFVKDNFSPSSFPKERGVLPSGKDSGWVLCPMIDARRMEVYCAVYNQELDEIEPVAAKVIDETSFSQLLENNKMYFFGDGAAKCRPLLSKHSNAVFVDGILCTSESMCGLAEEKFVKGEFENVALVEPFYLKEFVAGVRKSEN
jgi:tRNA threonylcarbamoyladenosine biosynthesis protein TsaB